MDGFVSLNERSPAAVLLTLPQRESRRAIGSRKRAGEGAIYCSCKATAWLGANRHAAWAAIEVLVCTGRDGSSSSLGGVREPGVQQQQQ